MEIQPRNPEFRNNPEIFHSCFETGTCEINDYMYFNLASSYHSL